MPRKKNGYGNFGVGGFKGVNNKVNKGKGSKALGNYPSERRFGSTVNRSVIEQYNIDSKWARWRRGLEYYFQGAYLEYTDTNAVLYQGTGFEIPVTFDGYRFATKNADSRTHYAIRRTVTSNRDLCTISEIQTDQREYPDQYARKEIWAKVDVINDDLLLRSFGEKVTDGETSANIDWILTSEKKPAVYGGKSPKEGTTITIAVPLDKLLETDYIKENNGNLQSLVGQAVYMPDFVINRPVTFFDIFNDGKDFFSVDTADIIGGAEVQILENTSTLPPLLGDVKDLTPIYKTSLSTGRLNSQFFFQKSRYQRFFGNQYLTAQVVQGEVEYLSYAIQPWNINSIRVDEASNIIELTSTPFQASLYLYTGPEPKRWLIFPDRGFTIQSIDTDELGNYNHAKPIPGEKLWQKLRIDVDPWMDQVFAQKTPLQIADLYTCSCPAYLHAVIRNPEVYGNDGLLNRQVRAPMPTAKGVDDYQLAGIGRVATIVQSWATSDYRKGFKICKHTIAAMFINKLRVEEPNDFPAFEGRTEFEEKLAADISEVVDEFTAQLERSEITTVEIIYALAEALNLDDIELGYVLATSRF